MRELTAVYGRKGLKASLGMMIEHDQVVAKRGTPSLPKLKFMEGLGPDDPRFGTDEPSARAA